MENNEPSTNTTPEPEPEPRQNELSPTDLAEFQHHCRRLNYIMSKYTENEAAKLKLYQTFNVVKTQLFNMYYEL